MASDFAATVRRSPLDRGSVYRCNERCARIEALRNQRAREIAAEPGMRALYARRLARAWAGAFAVLVWVVTIFGLLIYVAVARLFGWSWTALGPAALGLVVGAWAAAWLVARWLAPRVVRAEVREHLHPLETPRGASLEAYLRSAGGPPFDEEKHLAETTGRAWLQRSARDCDGSTAWPLIAFFLTAFFGHVGCADSLSPAFRASEVRLMHAASLLAIAVVHAVLRREERLLADPAAPTP